MNPKEEKGRRPRPSSFKLRRNIMKNFTLHMAWVASSLMWAIYFLDFVFNGTSPQKFTFMVISLILMTLTSEER